jgi:hypothetical protein
MNYGKGIGMPQSRYDARKTQGSFNIIGIVAWSHKAIFQITGLPCATPG